MQKQYKKSPNDKLIGININNRYKILRKLASGGMADVYLGKDLKLNNEVAIKILNELYSQNKNFIARFKKEAQILLKLDNPNIVRVFNFGQFKNLYFIIMEYIKGMSLKELIEKNGAINIKQAVKYSIQICNALEDAHSNNLIHRDIKSQNIMITDDDSIKVTDFGIAKTISDDLTKTISILGTAHYISPEQAQGQILDFRTDIYSLGIVMYEMITGDLPFRGGSSIDISLRHVNEIPQPISKIIPDIPTDIEKIIMKCLEKSPLRRYQSALELKRDLKNFTENKPLKIESIPFNSKNINLKSYLNLGLKQKNFEIYQKQHRLVTSILISIAFLTTALFLTFLILFLNTSSNFQALKEKESFVIVPPIENINIYEAEKIISALNLNLIVINEEYNENIPKNYIVKQTPQSNTMVKLNSNIEVTISLGKKTLYANVPNFIGLDIDNAIIAVEQAGFKVGKISQNFNDIYKEGIVFSQEPTYNMLVEEGSLINLVVSKGIEKITVPNLIGYDCISSKSTLENLGLQVEFKKVTSQENQPGLIIDMIPKAGTVVNKNEKIILLISTTDVLLTIPDLINLTLQQADEILSSLNIQYELNYIKVNYSIQKDIVVAQFPEAGENISQNEKVILFIGK